MKLYEFLTEASLWDTYLKSSKKDVGEMKNDLKKLESSLKKEDRVAIVSACRMIESSAKRIKDRMESMKYHE